VVTTTVATAKATYYDALLRLAACLNWRHMGQLKDGSWYGPAYFLNRLQDFDSTLRKHVSPDIIFDIARRYTCYGCGKGRKTDDRLKLTVDHVVPRALGGKDSAENAALLCKRCNPSKNDFDLPEWWAIQGKTLEMLDLDVLTVYIRNMFRLLSDEDRLYEPAPGPTLWLLERFAASLPTPRHTEAFHSISVNGLVTTALTPVGA
jgi:hypothetical protein